MNLLKVLLFFTALFIVSLTFSSTNLCSPETKALCGLNAEKCIPNQQAFSNVTCVCKNGYAGAFCDFVILPQSCSEIYSFQNPYKPGVFQLDLDGSGPLSPTWAYCDEKGDIVIEHNMPKYFPIRDVNENYDKFYEISYKHFSYEHIDFLLTYSKNCSQDYNVDCYNSPWDFKGNLSWFESFKYSDQKFWYLEDYYYPESRGQWYRSYRCDKIGQKLNEMGTLREFAGIKSIYLVQSPYLSNESYFKMHLSPLKCSGVLSNSVAILSLNSSLIYENLNSKSFSFEFRTSQNSIENVVAIFDFNQIFMISIENEYTVTLKHATDNNESETMTLITSKYILNDKKWHKIIFEFTDKEIRFSIDSFYHIFPYNNDMIDLKSPKNITFGQFLDNDGFIGCIQNIFNNGTLIDIKKFEQNGIFRNDCSNQCEKPCTASWWSSCEKNEIPLCTENLITGKPSCECETKKYSSKEFEYTFNGENSYALFKVEEEVIRYQTTYSYSSNTYEFKFSFKTNQKKALIFYFHDQSNNLAQIHLASDNRITFSMTDYLGNGNAEIVSCTVFPPLHIDYDDMQWHILHLSTDENNIIRLSIDNQHCEMPNTRKALRSIRISNFGKNSQDMVLPPKHKSLINPDGFDLNFNGFFGGVPRGLNGEGYQTYLPSFSGCIKSKDHIDTSNNDIFGIQDGCATCNSTAICNNNGYCINDLSLKNESSTACDCSKTSYVGGSCSNDTGITFSGLNKLIFHAKATKIFKSFEHQSLTQTFQFAFSPTPGIYFNEQRLATLIFENNKEIRIILTESNFILVESTTKNNSEKLNFYNNFRDGNRHFCKIDFDKYGPVGVRIDNQFEHFSPELKLNLGDIKEYIFGGDNTEKSISNNYVGCMSNALIDLHLNETTKFFLFDLYFDQYDELSKLFRTQPDSLYTFNRTECSGFLEKVLPTTEFPTWNVTFEAKEFNSNFTAIISEDILPSPPYILYGCLGIAAIMILLICCCKCCLRIRDKRGKYSRP